MAIFNFALDSRPCRNDKDSDVMVCVIVFSDSPTIAHTFSASQDALAAFALWSQIPYSP
jgi:hypothetical protein